MRRVKKHIFKVMPVLQQMYSARVKVFGPGFTNRDVSNLHFPGMSITALACAIILATADGLADKGLKENTLFIRNHKIGKQ